MSLNLNPRKPEAFEGKRDHMAVEPWIYSVESNLQLVQVGMQEAIPDNSKVMYAAALFSKSAAIWWLMIVQNNQIPET